MTARLWSVSVVEQSALSFGRRAREARNLITFLKARGAVVPDGWQLIAASLISADGNIIYGWGFNPDNLIEMYKVVLDLMPTPTPTPRPSPTARPRPTPHPRP